MVKDFTILFLINVHLLRNRKSEIMKNKNGLTLVELLLLTQ